MRGWLRERAALSEIGDEYMHLAADKLDALAAKGTLSEVACE